MGESSWVVQLSETLDNVMEESHSKGSYWKKRSIYKIPTCITDLNPSVYKPHTVSFGPYHHGALHLNPMEEHKWRALRQFIGRTPEKTSKHFVNAISEVVQDLKDCYDSLDPTWHKDTESFVKLMILDGCFMLEIMRTWSHTVNDDESKDPIFSGHGRLHIMSYIRRDMLMLENQLPMLVLDKLVAVENRECKDHVNKLILKFFSHDESRIPDQCLHVLDVYRKSLIKEGPSRKTRFPKVAMAHDTEDSIIPSATELKEAGIEFKVSDNISVRDISFKRGVLRLPIIIVDDITESMFLNVIAFEKFHVGAGNQVSTYILIMDSIIDKESDVVLLHKRGIIRSVIGSDKAVAKLFNSLSRDVTWDEDSDLRMVHRSVNTYSKQPWNKWRANLIYTYFRNPWVTLSLIAAILFFVVTILESVFNFFPMSKIF